MVRYFVEKKTAYHDSKFGLVTSILCAIYTLVYTYLIFKNGFNWGTSGNNGYNGILFVVYLINIGVTVDLIVRLLRKPDFYK